jgi:GT2 family glycosyltransferase
MNRTADLARTFLQNVLNNECYPGLEFVLLDYNSTDGLAEWVAENLMPHIEAGRVTYLRTEEPQWYSMAHSRNVAFRASRGEIVCNVDADNWTGPGFAAVLNELANQRPRQAIFTKGWQLLHGRLGFYRREWEEELGGYDESLEGYGFDDTDLLHRAYKLGFQTVRFDGRHVTRIKGADKTANFAEKNWRKSEAINREKSAANIARGALKANEGRPWGKAVLRKNFSEDLIL